MPRIFGCGARYSSRVQLCYRRGESEAEDVVAAIDPSEVAGWSWVDVGKPLIDPAPLARVVIPTQPLEKRKVADPHSRTLTQWACVSYCCRLHTFQTIFLKTIFGFSRWILLLTLFNLL